MSITPKVDALLNRPDCPLCGADWRSLDNWGSNYSRIEHLQFRHAIQAPRWPWRCICGDRCATVGEMAKHLEAQPDPLYHLIEHYTINQLAETAG